MSAHSKRTIVISNGTLIDGTGNSPSRNEAIVIQGNRIKSAGRLPAEIKLEDRENVEVINAAGQWIMPGLIDAHTHLSYGNPKLPGEAQGQGNDPARIQHPARGIERSKGAAVRCDQYLRARRDLVHRCRGARRDQTWVDRRPSRILRQPDDRHLRLDRRRRAVLGGDA